MKKKLFVFDLDFTLWNAGGTWCDCSSPPYSEKNGIVTDSNGNIIELYPDVMHIFKDLKKSGKKIGIASRTQRPDYARKLIQLFNIKSFIDFEEIYPTEKTQHFLQIQQNSELKFTEMIFFDDEMRNIRDVSALGVECILVDRGISSRHITHWL